MERCLATSEELAYFNKQAGRLPERLGSALITSVNENRRMMTTSIEFYRPSTCFVACRRISLDIVLRGMITAAQSRAGRALLDWSQEELARAAHLGLSTIRDFEKGRRVPTHNNLAGIKAALETAGVEFIPENGGGPGVRIKARSSGSAPE
jgi:hypothetical protein